MCRTLWPPACVLAILLACMTCLRALHDMMCVQVMSGDQAELSELVAIAESGTLPWAVVSSLCFSRTAVAVLQSCS